MSKSNDKMANSADLNTYILLFGLRYLIKGDFIHLVDFQSIIQLLKFPVCVTIHQASFENGSTIKGKKCS